MVPDSEVVARTGHGPRDCAAIAVAEMSANIVRHIGDLLVGEVSAQAGMPFCPSARRESHSPRWRGAHCGQRRVTPGTVCALGIGHVAALAYALIKRLAACKRKGPPRWSEVSQRAGAAPMASSSRNGET